MDPQRWQFLRRQLPGGDCQARHSVIKFMAALFGSLHWLPAPVCQRVNRNARRQGSDAKLVAIFKEHCGTQYS